ncbi:cation diffusion facilitator family transporter [Thermodesulfobacteriota bacterium]
MTRREKKTLEKTARKRREEKAWSNDKHRIEKEDELETIGKMDATARKQFKARLAIISLSLFIGAALMGVKFYAYALTGSSAILSDALESIINVVASAFALGSVLLAAKPPDETHPYGHGKIEYFSAGFEGALITLAAVGIFHQGWSHISRPTSLPHLEEGILLLVGAGLVNLILGASLIRIGQRTESLTLVADGKHVLTDVYTSAGVLLGLYLVELTGLLWLDGAVACGVGVQILFSGMSLVRKSFAGLMDESDPELLQEIARILNTHRKETWIDIHQLRAWRAGRNINIDFHLILPRQQSLGQVHDEVKNLERILGHRFGEGTNVLIHTDPCEDPDCPACTRYRCGLRKDSPRYQVIWNKDNLTLQGIRSIRPNIVRAGEDTSP